MLASRTILQPTDLSEDAAVAFRLADSLARDYAARPVVMIAQPPTPNGVGAVDRTSLYWIVEDQLAELREL